MKFRPAATQLSVNRPDRSSSFGKAKSRAGNDSAIADFRPDGDRFVASFLMKHLRSNTVVDTLVALAISCNGIVTFWNPFVGFAPSFDPFMLLIAGIPGFALYVFYLYAAHRLLIRCGLSQKLLSAAILIDFLIGGFQRTIYWPMFLGPHSFLVGLFRPPIPLSAQALVLAVAFMKWNSAPQFARPERSEGRAEN